MNILIAGDFCDRYRVSDAIQSGNFALLFDGIKNAMKISDYSIVNFEFPVVTDTKGLPIPKYGPHLAGQPAAIDAIKYAGFNCCTLANNHILDQGVECGIKTQQLLEEAGIDTVGFGKDKNAAARILFKTIGAEKIAIINCCEHEFCIAENNNAGANELNVMSQYYSIQEAKSHADYVIVIIHGGHEHFNLPSPRMKQTYRFFVDVGADAVLNHHQHCYSGYEVYQGKPIFYGLGNLLFDEPRFQHCNWNKGYMVQLNLSHKGVDYKLIPYTQCNEKPAVLHMEEKETAIFFEHLNKLNTIITDETQLQLAINKFYTNSAKWEIAMLEPYSGKIMSKLFALRVLPSWIKGEKLAGILNHTDCESHRDKLLFALKQKNK